MDIFTVSFFGHRYISDFSALHRALYLLIDNLLCRNEFVEFLVGRDGDFDILVSSVIHEQKQRIRNDNSAHVWILPYETADFRNNADMYKKYYDEIEIFSPSHSHSTHYKSAFQARNRSMVNRSKLIIFYVEHKGGGAFQTMCYAAKKKKNYINLADCKSFMVHDQL